MLQHTCVRAGGVLAALVVLSAGGQAPPPYAHVATVDSIVDGQPFRAFAYDHAARRFYAGSDRGLFWIDMTDDEPRLKGPLVRKDILAIEAAPDLGRVFYITDEEVGYADLRTPGTTVRVAPRAGALDIAYEPTRRELYAGSRTSRIRIYDAASGERGADVELPGWWAANLEAIPGRVLLNVGGADGIHVIDAGTRKAARWELSRRFATPAYIEADPLGRYVFLNNSRDIAVVDAKTGRVLGTRATPTPAAIAFDPATSRLIASWADDPPPVRIVVFGIGENGLRQEAELENPVRGQVGMESTSGGFLQDGIRTLLVWRVPSHGPGRWPNR
jgi:hypothetical protein